MSARRRSPDRGPELFGEPATGREGSFAPRVIAGVDEAGLGPMLGPLAIGMSAFRVPDAQADMWHTLAGACAREIKRDDLRVVVADSKVVFTRTDDGARRLERTVLAFDALRSNTARLCSDTGTFIAGAALDEAHRREPALEPWWPSMPRRLAHESDDADLDDTARRLADALRAAGIEPAGLWVRAVPATVLNAAFARTDNKSTTHWESCVPFFRELWTRFGHEGVDAVVDRHGGRMHYTALLREAFPLARVELIGEVPARSEYMITDADGRTMRITFAEKSESFSFSVALASCAAKYAREACMAAFNAYFRVLDPELVPTAGYYNDARRWLEEAGSAIERSGLPRDVLVRSR